MGVWIPKEKDWDILVDTGLEEYATVMRWVRSNFPGIRTRGVDFERLRYCRLFEVLGATRMVIAKRSATTYLACMMKVPLVEHYPDDLPRTLLAKPASNEYRVIYGEGRAMNVWTGVEDLWQQLSGTSYLDVTQMAQPPSTAEIVSVR